MPAASMWWLAGTQVPADDIAVVPPSTGDFSSTSTVAPSTEAASAAARPAAPEPTTMTSHSRSRVETGMEIGQKVEHVEHRQAERRFQGGLVGRQVGAFEHDGVDVRVFGDQ